MEQLQKEIDVWEAITDKVLLVFSLKHHPTIILHPPKLCSKTLKVGTNLNDLVPILGLPSGADDEGRPGAGGDPISTLLSVFSLVLVCDISSFLWL